ncbi:MAG: alanine racemase [Trueperaceae bacterium]
MPVAHIDLAVLRHNLELLRTRLGGGCQVLAAVKAGAYGHGTMPVARALEASGVSWFGVATPAEALELRRDGVRGEVLLFGPAFGGGIAELVEADVILTIANVESLEAIRRSGAPGRSRVHLKADTGMGRLGYPPDGALKLAREVDNDPLVELEGVWTHFAKADEADRTFTEAQISSFEGFLATLEREGIVAPVAHACNSAGLLAYPAAHYELVRPGIALYGYPPGYALAGHEPGLTPVMTITAPVTFLKRVREGTPVSYGATWRAPRDTTIATVRFGYADGYPRLLGNRGWATLHGSRVPVAGRICMDQLMLDVGDLEVSPGDRVTLLGPKGPTAAELGKLAETISYEMLTSVSPRVERVYSD